MIQLLWDRLRPGIQPKLEALRALYEGKKIIVGRDKLDVVKGVVQKVGLLVGSVCALADTGISGVPLGSCCKITRRGSGASSLSK